jgi:NADPH:quinone reductase-like Zn-dependent oxidoreductase
MKAIVQTRYGRPEEVLELRELDRPKLGAGEVLVRVRASSVHADVWHVVTGFPLVLRLMGSGLLRPKLRVPGTDLAGTVEAVGRDVTRFKVGDAVFGESHGGFQWKNGGAFAELAAVPEDALVLKPGNVSFEQAAAVATAGYIALSNLRFPGALGPGRHVLVNGAAGAVGSVALQVARARGARVTGVDSTEKLELIRSLGADHVVDYTQEDVTRGHARYDLIFDVASTLSISSCKRILAPTGIYVLIGHDHYGRRGRGLLGSLPAVLGLAARALFNRHLPSPFFSAPPKQAVMTELQDLLAAGKLTPIIDRTYPLESVPDAIRRLTDGDALGRLIITPCLDSR